MDLSLKNWLTIYAHELQEDELWHEGCQSILCNNKTKYITRYENEGSSFQPFPMMSPFMLSSWTYLMQCLKHWN